MGRKHKMQILTGKNQGSMNTTIINSSNWIRVGKLGAWMGLSAVLAASASSFAQGIQPSAGKAPSVTPTLVARPASHQFQNLSDEHVNWQPPHPALHTLPPVPMLT